MLASVGINPNDSDIDNNTIITIELKLSDTTINHANNSDGNPNPKTNCFHDVPNSSQHTKARMKTKVICIVVDSTMYNGDGVRDCFHNNDITTINNKIPTIFLLLQNILS